MIPGFNTVNGSKRSNIGFDFIAQYRLIVGGIANPQWPPRHLRIFFIIEGLIIEGIEQKVFNHLVPGVWNSTQDLDNIALGCCVRGLIYLPQNTD